MSGVTPNNPVAPPGCTLRPVLTSSKASNTPYLRVSWRTPVEIAGVGRDDAGVHHHRLHDHSGDRALVGVQHALERLEIVERHEVHEIGHRLRDAGDSDADEDDRRGRAWSRLRHCETITESWWP